MRTLIPWYVVCHIWPEYAEQNARAYHCEFRRRANAWRRERSAL